MTTPKEPSDTLRPQEPTVPSPSDGPDTTTSTTIDSGAEATTTTTTTTTTTAAPTTTTQVEGVVLSPTQQALADVAVRDLVERRSVEDDDITVVEVAEVTWPDASLGCPRRDMQYQQVLTPGVRVILEAGGVRAHYHGTSVSDLAYCAAPRPATQT